MKRIALYACLGFVGFWGARSSAAQDLLQGDGFTLRADPASADPSEWCSSQAPFVHLDLWFPGDENTVIEDGEAYRKIIFGSVLPFVEQRCPGQRLVYIKNKIEGFSIGMGGVVLPRGTVLRGMTVGLSKFEIERGRQGWVNPQFKYFNETLDLPGGEDGNLISLAKLKAWYDRKPAEERKRIEDAVARQQEWWQERDLEQARNAPVDCDKKAAGRGTPSGPSAQEICRAVTAYLGEAAVKVASSEDLYTALTGKKSGSPFTIHLAEFELRSCQPEQGGETYTCDYDLRLEPMGGGPDIAPFLKSLVRGSYRSRSQFTRAGGAWRQQPPPPTPYSELPCCWLGDVRMAGFFQDCREQC